MKNLSNLNNAILIAAARYLEVRKDGESKGSVFKRDKKYENLMKKVKTEREAIDVSFDVMEGMYSKILNKLDEKTI